jgi:hypothetical protein
MAAEELREMPLIVHSGKKLQGSSLSCWAHGTLCVPEGSLKGPRKVSEKDSEFENLLRSAVRLLKPQKSVVRSKTAENKGNRKVR